MNFPLISLAIPHHLNDSITTPQAGKSIRVVIMGGLLSEYPLLQISTLGKYVGNVTGIHNHNRSCLIQLLFEVIAAKKRQRTSVHNGGNVLIVFFFFQTQHILLQEPWASRKYLGGRVLFLEYISHSPLKCMQPQTGMKKKDSVLMGSLHTHTTVALLSTTYGEWPSGMR